jgi:hypothetical protein
MAVPAPRTEKELSVTSTVPERQTGLRVATGREQVYDVDLAGTDPEALVRVLTTLRRRRCTITHVAFAAADRHRPARLTIGLEPPAVHGHVVASWLDRLVDVAAVRPRR